VHGGPPRAPSTASRWRCSGTSRKPSVHSRHAGDGVTRWSIGWRAISRRPSPAPLVGKPLAHASVSRDLQRAGVSRTACARKGVRCQAHPRSQGRDGRRPSSLAQAVRGMMEAVPWGHHVELLSKLDDAGQRLLYLKATARFDWNRNVLLNRQGCPGMPPLRDGSAATRVTQPPSRRPPRAPKVPGSPPPAPCA